MNPIIKFILRILSYPGINMKEDYERVRKIQSFFSRKPDERFRFLDKKIYSVKDNHEIPIRVFFPDTVPTRNESLIYIHGGGWTIGDIDTYSQTCQNIADEFNIIVYSIDYRLAPEHRYPIPFEDCYHAVEVLMRREETQLNQEWIIMGDSAGGNLAASVCLRLKEENKELPVSQILLYPLTYWDHSSQSPFESIKTKGKDYGLTSKKIQEYMENYVPDETQRKDRFVSPLMACDLKGQPDTLIITAEHDPLRDEGEAYGKALEDAGNTVKIHRIEDSVHGFISLPTFSRPVEETFSMMHEFLDQ